MYLSLVDKNKSQNNLEGVTSHLIFFDFHYEIYLPLLYPDSDIFWL